MPIPVSELKTLIREAFPDADIEIRALAADDDHYAASIISESFRGKNRVQQHQMVYEALQGRMGNELHALALQTGVPEEDGKDD